MKITRERRAKRYSKIAVEICLVLLKKAKAKQIFLLKEWTILKECKVIEKMTKMSKYRRESIAKRIYTEAGMMIMGKDSIDRSSTSTTTRWMQKDSKIHNSKRIILEMKIAEWTAMDRMRHIHHSNRTLDSSQLHILTTLYKKIMKENLIITHN